MDDPVFLAAFEAAAIPESAWHHRDHLRVAYLYLRDRSFDDALEALRCGIRALNRAHATLDGLTMGYHETATVAWARIIRASIDARRESVDGLGDFAAFIAEAPDLLEKTRLRRHYSAAVLPTERAKLEFVEPDGEALPEIRDWRYTEPRVARREA